MIERGTFGSIKEFSVLDYIYDYYDRSDKLIQTHIRKIILDMNYAVSHLKKIDDLSFKMRTSILYKNDIKDKISKTFSDKDIEDRLLNLCYAKFNNIINDARKKAHRNKIEFRKQQKEESLRQNNQK